jgi:hypothetical protein
VCIQGRLQCRHLISFKFTKGSKVIKVFLYTHLRSLNVHHFGMAEATRLKKCDIEGNLSASTFLPNFTNIHQSVKKLLVGDRHIHRQAGDLISSLSFFESRLKTCINQQNILLCLYSLSKKKHFYTLRVCSTISLYLLQYVLVICLYSYGCMAALL